MCQGQGPVVVAHVGAGKLPNIWPSRHFAAVLQALQQERGARVVLSEGPRDADPVADVAAHLGARRAGGRRSATASVSYR
jgi:ADP-heptose:LPS heptosyltransferase